ERDDDEVALAGDLDGSDDVRRVSARRDRDEDVAFASERAHLAREHLLEGVVVGDRGEDRRIGGERDRGELGPLALVAADELGGQMLAVGGRSAVAADEDLAVGGERRRHALDRNGDGSGQDRSGVALELGAVFELLADAIDEAHARTASHAASYDAPTAGEGRGDYTVRHATTRGNDDAPGRQNAPLIQSMRDPSNAQTSKRHGGQRSPKRRFIQRCASRCSRRRLPASTDAAAPPKSLRARLRTSTKTMSPASRMTRSISPRRLAT